MHGRIWRLPLWDQSRAVDNARWASTELTRARNERLEVDAFVARILAERVDDKWSA
jgi:hypothetical protein